MFRGTKPWNNKELLMLRFSLNLKDAKNSCEILKFLVTTGDPSLFINFAKKTIMHLEIESDFLEFMEMVSDFYRRLDIEEKEKKIQKIIKKREKIDLFEEVSENDEDIGLLYEIISK